MLAGDYHTRLSLTEGVASHTHRLHALQDTIGKVMQSNTWLIWVGDMMRHLNAQGKGETRFQIVEFM